VDRDVELDAEAAVVADATHVVAHAGEVERNDHWAAVAEGPVGIAGGALIVLCPGHLHHVVEPIFEPENCIIHARTEEQG
jgi:hypothetical protein